MKKLSFFLMAMLFSVMSFAAESLLVTLDFSKNTWELPVASANKTTATVNYTSGDYTITLAGGGSGNGHYYNNDGYLIFGKSGATLTLPAFDFKTTKIVVTGRTGASTSVLQNIYVGATAVSTQTKGAAVTNTYAIAEDYQAAGNVYVLKVTSSHNTQIVKMEIYGEEGGEEPETPVEPEEPEEPVVPEVPENLGAKTIAEFLEMKNTTDTCVLTGVVANIANTTYGNFDLVDATGSVYVYGLLTAAGESQKFASMDIAAGDTLTIKAIYNEYNSKAQAKNAIYVSHTKAAAPVVPENLGAKTIAEFLELKNTTDTCVLTGVVANIVNTTYGNFDLVDATGTVYVYGLLTAAGESKQFASMDIAAGDTLTVKAIYNEYNSKAQAKNAIYVSHTKVATPIVPENLGAKTIAEFLELKNTTDTCVLTGVVANIVNTTYGNFDLVDATGSVYVYGLLTAAGEKQQFASMDIAAGDTLTVKAIYNEYNGNPQAKNAIYVSHSKLVLTVAVTSENGTVDGLADGGKYVRGEEATLTATANEGYEFVNWTVGEEVVSTENPYSFVVTADIALVANFEKEPEPEYMDFELPISNSVFDTETMAFSGSHTDYAIEVSLIPDMEKPIEGEEMTFGLAAASTITREDNPMEIIEGQITVVDVQTASANAIVAVKYGEDYYRFIITMTQATAETIQIELTGPAITVAHEDNILSFTSTWTYNEVEYPFNVKLNGVETLETKNYEAPQVAELQIGGDGDDDPWLDWAVANEAQVVVEEGTIMFYASFTSFATGTNYVVTIATSLPAKTISYELNGGELPTATVPTQDSLIAAFKDGYNAYFGVSVATTRAIDNFLYAGAAVNDPTCDVSLFMKDDASPWKWLGDYVLAVTNAQIEAGTLSTLKELATELMWRQSLTGFFLQQAKLDSSYKGNADFTEAGKPEAWGAAYQAAHAVVLPTEPVDAPYTLPTPVKEGYTFVGWYDNAEGTGEPYTVIPAGWSGTLYAIWEVEGPGTALENIAVEGKAVKAIINGQLIIIKNGVQYNAQGAVVK